MANSGQIIQDGKIYQNVEFVYCAADAEMELLYDKIEYDWEQKILLYMRHGNLVATAPMQGAMT